MKLKTIKTEDITIGARHRKDMGDLQPLAVSIEAEGLLQPIGITPGNELVFGERRLRAIKDILGWDRLPCAVVNVSSIAAGEYAEAGEFYRKNLEKFPRFRILWERLAQVRREAGR